MRNMLYESNGLLLTAVPRVATGVEQKKNKNEQLAHHYFASLVSSSYNTAIGGPGTRQVPIVPPAGLNVKNSEAVGQQGG